MKTLSYVVMCAALVFLGFTLGKVTSMETTTEKPVVASASEPRFELVTYTGVGSGVYKHGTIVKVVDGQPKVVGSFHDDSGKDYPGTVEIREVK